MNHGSLFSGIGGFDLAAQWMGWTNVFHCEWNPFAQRILKHYWPRAGSYDDITKSDFTIHRGTIDVLSGGFPCQPYSSAGKRLGKEDNRHLWPEMLRAIREIQPRWVVGENVRGLTNWNGGMVFDEIQADLENEGYEVTPYLLPAVAVNAPHRRDRIWFVSRLATNADRNGLSGHSEPAEIVYADGNGIPRNDSFALPGSRIVADAGGQGLPAFAQNKQRSVRQAKAKQPGSKSGGAHAAPNGWGEFPTESPVRAGNDGLPSELDGIAFSSWIIESIKGAGNAIVPQVGLQIFRAIDQYENLYCKL